MLTVENLRVGYPRAKAPVIDGLSFSLSSGGVLAVLGPSGCGKTTLLNLLGGTMAPQAGSVSFSGKPLTPEKVSIGLIPQHYGLLPWKTVRENIRFCSDLRGNTDETALQKLCARLGLLPLLGRYPRELSGGQAQRTALARALLMQPQLLLMDEPFAALDAAAAWHAKLLCQNLLAECGATAIIVTHRPEEALFLAGQIAVMQPGGRFRLVAENPWRGIDGCDAPGFHTFSQRLRTALLQAAGEGGGNF